MISSALAHPRDFEVKIHTNLHFGSDSPQNCSAVNHLRVDRPAAHPRFETNNRHGSR